MTKKKKKAEKSEDTLYLITRKRPKGILRIIFSRFLIIFVLFALQILLFVSIFDLSETINGLGPVSLFVMLFILGMFFHLFRSDMDSTAKLTWLLLMFMFPLQISVLLWMTEKHIGHRKIERRLAQLNKKSRGKLKYDESLLSKEDIISSGTKNLCSYLKKSGDFPLYKNTMVTYFPLGEDKFKAMLEELKKAEKFIFMEYFIIDEGYMWGSILKILAEKAKQGVDVRVMYDGMCEMSTLTYDYPKRMAKLGIKCKSFSKLMPFISTSYNYRDHRKILIIDGKTAFNGGVNLADECCFTVYN